MLERQSGQPAGMIASGKPELVLSTETGRFKRLSLVPRRDRPFACWKVAHARPGASALALSSRRS